jgi:hypothetical protein
MNEKYKLTDYHMETFILIDEWHFYALLHRKQGKKQNKGVRTTLIKNITHMQVSVFECQKGATHAVA